MVIFSRKCAGPIQITRTVLNNHAFKKIFFTSSKRSWVRLTYPITFIKDNIFEENITSSGDKNAGLIRKAEGVRTPTPIPPPPPRP